MADEIFKPDANFKAGGLVGGVSSVDGSSKLVLRLNPTTKRLLVDVNGATTVTDGEAVDATDVGTLVLGTDGSNYQILSTNSSGRLQVDIVSGGGGGTQYQEDAAHSSGDTGTLALVVRKDTAAQLAGTDGDYTALITDANGRLHVLDQNSAAILSALQGTLVVNSELPAAAALADTTANPTVPGVGAYLMGYNGVTWDRVQAYYSNSDNLATLTGLAVVGQNRVFDGANWDMMRGDSTDGVLVNLGANNDVTITGTVTVGSHAVTNAGTFVVQENGAALTSLQLIDNLVLAEDQASANADPGVQMLAVRKATPANTSGLDGDYEPLQVSAGRLWASVVVDTALPAGTNAIGKLAANSGVDIGDVDVTTVGTITPGTAAANLGKAEDAAHSSGDVGVMLLTVRQNTAAALAGSDADYQPLITDTNGRLHVLDANSASALTSLQLIDDPVIADDAAFTPATTKVMMAGFEADETSTDSVDEGDGGAARMTLDRKQIVTIQPHTAGGWSTFNATSGDSFTALTNSAQVVKGSAGQLGGWYIYNPNSSAAYVVIYNVAAASVTVGTTNPKIVLCIPATSAANLELVNGIPFDTAISVAAATTGGGNSAPSTALECMLWYK